MCVACARRPVEERRLCLQTKRQPLFIWEECVTASSSAVPLSQSGPHLHARERRRGGMRYFEVKGEAGGVM